MKQPANFVSFGRRSLAAAGLRLLVLVLAASFLIAARGPSALAEGFAIYSLGGRATALNGAVTARRPKDPTVLAYNPSLAARLEKNAVTAGLTVIGTQGRVQLAPPVAGGTSHTSHSAYHFLPHMYFNYRLTDRLVLGISEFSRFGLGNEFQPDWPGQYNVYKILFQTMSLNTVLAANVTDDLSVAAGLEVMYAALTMRKKIPMFDNNNGAYLGQADLFIDKAKDVTWGFGLSAHYQFDQQWAMGLSYRAPVKIRASGPVSFRNDNPGDPTAQAYFAQVFHNGDVSGVVTLPENISVGLSFTPTERLSLEANVIWTRWTRYKELALNLPAPLGLRAEDKNWKNNWRLGFGVEYALTDWLDLRGGYSYITSPMIDALADYNVPTNGRHNYSVGLGFHSERYSLDLAYSFVDCKDRDYSRASQTGNGTLDSKSRGFLAHEMVASFTYYLN